ncbi:hypothetical protein GCM10027341_27360 [Spirosoma knui]
MKTALFLLFFSPIWLLAQPSVVPSLIQTDTLKLIESELQPGYYNRYGQTVRSQYMYDGLDIKAKNLKPYIMASGDPMAIREFQSYLNGRHAGGWLIAGGITTAIIGAIIMGSNGPNSDGKFIVQQPIVCPPGYACGSSTTGGGMVYGGQIAGYQDVIDTKRQNTYAGGGITLISGAILAGIGWGMQIPGQHVRRAVQYYNRTLKQRGVSWQVKPYSSISNSGIGLVGRF